MPDRSIITLTTDFGHGDPFVGQMKGVMLGINPDAVIVDITHGVSPHDVLEAALAVGESHRYFPKWSIHVAVVDPGVGSGRRPLLVEAGEHFFIGPDNGIFSDIYRQYENPIALNITATHYFLRSPGNTFHGRDVFAPVAAWLSRGVSKGIGPENIGEPVTDYVLLPIPEPAVDGDSVTGEVLHIDRFGNAITNIRAEALKGPSKVVVKGRDLEMKGYYADAGEGEAGALINSSGLLEIFVYKGSAAKALDIRPGERVGCKGQ